MTLASQCPFRQGPRSPRGNEACPKCGARLGGTCALAVGDMATELQQLRAENATLRDEVATLRRVTGVGDGR